MLSLPASEASTLQQQAMSAVVELLIALFAALPELLRKRPVGAKRHQSEPEIDGTYRQPEVAQAPQPVPQTAIVIPERPTPRLVSSSRNEPAVSTDIDGPSDASPQEVLLCLSSIATWVASG